jgi:FkbH-like protein
MKLVEALEILKCPVAEGASPFSVYLVSSFTPLHLQTFLAAKLCKANPELLVHISTGLYGDIRGNLTRMSQSNSSAAAIVLEWGDFDARLGLRSLGSWDPEAAGEILENAQQFAKFLDTLLRCMPVKFPVSISSPTLPLLPISPSPSWNSSKFELSLRLCVTSLLEAVSELENLQIVSSEQLDAASPITKRLDLKSEYASGFPYHLPHASELAHRHAKQLLPLNPKKGLITDLDDTLWLGILGEVGVDGISWDLEHGAQSHGSYQRFLQSLNRTGVLLAAASKNDPTIVREALQRSDLLLAGNVLYPIEANWGPKSESVNRILKTWNIAADSVVFIDDSPMELAEVKATHPDIECLLFQKTDPGAVLDLQYRLRDLFGKRRITQEDAIRQQSIRIAGSFRTDNGDGNVVSDDFLHKAEAELTLDFRKQPLDPRALELVNKTNQFNLNGRRWSDAEWLAYMQDTNSILVLVSYRDKYGPLGKISVLAGRKSGQSMEIDVWVLSCRAFSRRIEHRLIQELFHRFELKEIVFRFEATSKNGLLQEFLHFAIGQAPSPSVGLTRAQFDSINPVTYHNVLEPRHG